MVRSCRQAPVVRLYHDRPVVNEDFIVDESTQLRWKVEQGRHRWALFGLVSMTKIALLSPVHSLLLDGVLRCISLQNSGTLKRLSGCSMQTSWQNNGRVRDVRCSRTKNRKRNGEKWTKLLGRQATK